MKRNADWLAWSLQFIFGLVIGPILGLYAFSKRRGFSGSWLQTSDQILIYFFVAALIGAGIASFYGDRLWLGSAYRVIPPDDIKHSKVSSIVSILAIILGGSLILFTIFRYYRLF